MANPIIDPIEAVETTPARKLNAPKIRKFKGELVQISPLDSNEITLITVQEVDGSQVTVSTSNKYWKAVGKLFNVGSIIAGEYEERVKDSTEYESNGTVSKHTSSGNNLAKVSAYSQSAWMRECMGVTRESDLLIINSVELERQNAIANYLATSFAAMR